MLKKSITVHNVIDLLNELSENDMEMMSCLIDARVECNQKTIDHPTVQVTKEDTVGLLGILNGLFGVGSNGRGPIGCYVDKEKHVRFVKTINQNDNHGYLVDETIKTCCDLGIKWKHENGKIVFEIPKSAREDRPEFVRALENGYLNVFFEPAVPAKDNSVKSVEVIDGE